MKKFAIVLLLAALFAPGFIQAAFAQQDRDHEGHRNWRRDRHWHGDIHHFRDRDLRYWHSGHWFHGRHGGDIAWWWVLGNQWYSYPAPAYPYPDPFIPPVVAPVVAPAPVIAPAAPPVAVSYLYFCRNPRGYYPYVPACARPWRLEPAY